MSKKNTTISSVELEAKTRWFVGRCREAGLKVTPQRLAIYKELLGTDEHPSAEMLYEKLKPGGWPSLSLDTVNRTVLTLSEIGAAFIVEGSGGARRFDAGLEHHQHFKCVKCERIFDFHHEPFDDIQLPPAMTRKFKVLRKTVYVEGLCDLCK
ncbi:MAG: transcriptional repressor [Phycisphaerae bacterium]|nr:transcriptional repressor [Phycisphaerae bacterium]